MPGADRQPGLDLRHLGRAQPMQILCQQSIYQF
jgi:hypothetical protein